MAGAAAPSGTPGGLGPAEPEDARGWRSPEHGDRVAELFGRRCRRCRRCTCALCWVLGSHRGHPVGLALEEAARLQKLTQECLKNLTTKKQQQVGNITQQDAAEKLKASGGFFLILDEMSTFALGHTVSPIWSQGKMKTSLKGAGQAHAESSKTWLTRKFTELRLLLDEEEALTKKFIEKNTQLALQAYREQIESCGEQMDVMNNLSNRVWNISQEPSPLQLLQACTAAEQQMQQQMSLGESCHPVPHSFEPVKSFFKGLVEAMQSPLQTPLDVRLKANENCQLSGSSSAQPGSLLKTSPSPERSLFLKHARMPTLEPDALHARVRLSADRPKLRCGHLGGLGLKPALHFDALWQVLGRDCFDAGSHYWEVDVQEAGVGWWVGAAYGSLRRRGASAATRLGCYRQSWSLELYDLEYWAFHDGQRSRLRPRDDPDRLAVFLDEVGVFTFYDVTGGMTHQHTFRAAFQELLYPALRLWEGAISISRLP
ncbi:LOW QUALITY PROTEIN: tripartite motif-containing protein 14 [Megaptera novaeangliae]